MFSGHYGKSSGTWGKDIRDVLISYCNEYGVSATSTYYIGSWDIYGEIGRGRPVILFGYLPGNPSPLSTRGLMMHAVTAYGVSNATDGSKLIVHYGWRGYEQVGLDIGLMGSSTQFVVN